MTSSYSSHNDRKCDLWYKIMSRAYGLQKLVNAPYKRICPGLCPTCVHFNAARDTGWYLCDKLHKRLSNPHTTPGRCAEYEQGEQKLTDAEIQTLHDDAIEMTESKKARRAKSVRKS